MDCCDNSMAMGRVVCPKPRRVGPSIFNSVMPLRFHIRSNDPVAFDSKPGAELLDLILRKKMGNSYKATREAVDKRTESYELEGRQEVTSQQKEGYEAERSSPPFLFGSPPCRAPNPVVQDVHFRVEQIPTTISSPSDSAAQPSAHSRVKFGNKQAAAVRVEGFDCQSSCFAAMAYN